jgi:OmpA-OmpF porin, OOP family
MRQATLALLGVLLSTVAARADATFEVQNGALVVPGPVLFETGSDRIKAESDPVLAHVKAYLDAKSYISLLRIEGHTDRDGNPVANQTLTEKRALSVARWLVAHGVDCKRLIAVGFGGEKPVASNDTPANKAQNRRVMFVNAALRGHAIGGAPADGGGKVAGDPCSK